MRVSRVGGTRYREKPGPVRNSAGLRININQGNLEMVPSLSNSSRSSQGEPCKRLGGEENFHAKASATEGNRKAQGSDGDRGARGGGGFGALARMLGFGGGRLAKRSGEENRVEFMKRDEDASVEKSNHHFQVERTKIFCKITGLKGDIDNEPHSPRSSKGGLEGSFQSEENV